MPAKMMGVDVTGILPKKVKKEKKAKKEEKKAEKKATKTDKRRALREMSSPDVSFSRSAFWPHTRTAFPSALCRSCGAMRQHVVVPRARDVHEPAKTVHVLVLSWV